MRVLWTLLPAMKLPFPVPLLVSMYRATSTFSTPVLKQNDGIITSSTLKSITTSIEQYFGPCLKQEGYFRGHRSQLTVKFKLKQVEVVFQ